MILTWSTPDSDVSTGIDDAKLQSPIETLLRVHLNNLKKNSLYSTSVLFVERVL